MELFFVIRPALRGSNETEPPIDVHGGFDGKDEDEIRSLRWELCESQQGQHRANALPLKLRSHHPIEEHRCLRAKSVNAAEAGHMGVQFCHNEVLGLVSEKCFKLLSDARRESARLVLPIDRHARFVVVWRKRPESDRQFKCGIQLSLNGRARQEETLK